MHGLTDYSVQKLLFRITQNNIPSYCPVESLRP